MRAIGHKPSPWGFGAASFICNIAGCEHCGFNLFSVEDVDGHTIIFQESCW